MIEPSHSSDPATPPAGRLSGDLPGGRGLAAAAFLLSLLQGAFLALAATSLVVRIGGVGIAMATLGLAWAGLFQCTPRRLRQLLFLVTAQLLLFVSQPTAMTPPSRWRLLMVAIALCYGAGVMTVLLVASRLVGLGESLLCSFSMALALFAGDMVASRLQLKPWVGAEWVGASKPHPILGHVYAPHSTAEAFYPDNPRGYFEVADGRKARWSLETHEGSMARLELPADDPQLVRVVIERMPQGVPWHVQLSGDWARLSLKGGRRYTLTFEARADAPRLIRSAVSQAHAPWDSLGLYKEVAVGPVWQKRREEFTASSDDDRARLLFDLGGSPHAVELRDATLRRLPGGELVDTPTVRYSVSYRFNDFGCRGPDYAIPRPAGVVRILALGDSYVMGMGVHERDAVSARLEALLNERSKPVGPSFEVINCGVSGYATREERISYEMSSWRYEAQLVLLGMVFNDDKSWLDEARDREKLDARVGQTFALWRAVRERPETPDFSQSIEEIKKLDEACKRRGAKLAVFYFRNSPMIGAWRELVQQVSQGLRGTGLPVADLGPALLRDHSMTDLQVHQRVDGHPNEIGHRLAAEELVHFLDKEQLLAGAPTEPSRRPPATPLVSSQMRR